MKLFYQISYLYQITLLAKRFSLTFKETEERQQLYNQDELKIRKFNVSYFVFSFYCTNFPKEKKQWKEFTNQSHFVLMILIH